MADVTATANQGQPAVRRKSCTACSKAKRRCDLGLPACLRCSKMKLECTYPTKDIIRRRAKRLKEAVGGNGGDEGPVEAALASAAGTPSGQDPSWDHLLEMPSYSPLETDLPLSPSIPLSGLGSTGFGLDVLDFSPALPPTLPNTFTMDPMAALQPDKMTLSAPITYGIQRDISLAPVRYNSQPFPVDSLTPRLMYIFSHIIKAPQQMALETQTSWCHPSLYTDYMPESMQNALACCGLYAIKNERNAMAVMRVVETQARNLAASPLPSSPLELLARLQALFLYQIMRLFDSDIGARSRAQATNADLDRATVALRKHLYFDQALPDNYETQTLALYPLGETREFWKQWVFLESGRRTYHIASFAAIIYQFANQQFACKTTGAEAGTKCTMSAHLWAARDAVDFAVAWRDKKHYVVDSLNFTEFLRDAVADDVDAYGKVIIATLLGVDEAKGWLLTRGGIL